ncbi:DUF5808 domain-containing protein [Clostridium amazonitimonense]|uniref:DUF5808 domain-containing protein n=1 Tax=Clostridium amazonitimonense TaxID=1499689 RepID=UPI00050947A1|nr:DUF5808 domain-containing protein [Clostridium amazonitimonense]
MYIIEIFIMVILYFIGYFSQSTSRSEVYYGVRIPKSAFNREDIKHVDKCFKRNWNISYGVLWLVIIVLQHLFKEEYIPLFFYTGAIASFLTLNICHYKSYKAMKLIKSKENWNFYFPKGDDDENYIMGTMYYNKKDPSIITKKRIGIGWDLNIGKLLGKIFIIITAIIIIGGFLLMLHIPAFTKDRVIDLNENALKIEGAYGKEISLKDIKTVTYENKMPRIKCKRNGATSCRKAYGYFNVEGKGKSLIFINDVEEPCIAIELQEGTWIFINKQDENITKSLYDNIKEQLR